MNGCMSFGPSLLSSINNGLSVHCFCHFSLFVNINDLHNIGLDNLRNEAFFFSFISVTRRSSQADFHRIFFKFPTTI